MQYRERGILINDFLAVPFQMLLPPGYTSLQSMKNTVRMRKALGAQKRLSIDELTDSGTVVLSSPRACATRPAPASSW